MLLYRLFFLGLEMHSQVCPTLDLEETIRSDTMFFHAATLTLIELPKLHDRSRQGGRTEATLVELHCPMAISLSYTDTAINYSCAAGIVRYIGFRSRLFG